jgi:serralysin
VTPRNTIPEIDGAFKAFAEVRFDDLAGGTYTREHDLIGQSNWSWDTPLIGKVSDLFFVG